MSDFHCSRLATLPGAGAVTDRPKNYAVGLEKRCPGGAQSWAPEIPSIVGHSIPGSAQV
jgi:hypothetical protein